MRGRASKLRSRAAAVCGVLGGLLCGVALEASAALARPFVPTTTFEFGADGGLRQVSGRMLPMAGDAKSPKALDGVLRMSAAQSSCNSKSLS